eukprot:32392-Eustigmatos_ZCMA.PRE.1
MSARFNRRSNLDSVLKNVGVVELELIGVENRSMVAAAIHAYIFIDVTDESCTHATGAPRAHTRLRDTDRLLHVPLNAWGDEEDDQARHAKLVGPEIAVAARA